MTAYYGTDDADTITGSSRKDRVYGYGGDDILDGGAGGDRIYGGTGKNQLSGGLGGDAIYSQGGVDAVDGGDGLDFWYGDYSSATTGFRYHPATHSFSNGTSLANIEAIVLTTGSGRDVFAIDDFADLLRLSVGVDINLSTGDGDDSVTATGKLNFVIDGGAGRDSLNLDLTDRSPVPGQSIEIGGTRSFSGSASAGFGRVASFSNIEDLTVKGSDDPDYGDHFRLDTEPLLFGNTLSLDGGNGVDRIDIDCRPITNARFSVAADGTVSSNVGAFSNIERFNLTLGTGTNVVTLGDGADRIDASTGGSNTLDGGGGDDFIIGQGTIDGGAGDDTITAVSSAATIDGGEGFDRLIYTALRADAGYSFDDATTSFSNGLTVTGVEALTLTGTRNADQFHLTTAGPIVIDGSGGNDTATIDLSGFDHGVGLVDPNANFGETFLSNVENITYTGSAFDDTVRVAASVAAGTDYDGGDGVDTLIANLGNAGDTFIVADDGTIASSLGRFADFERFDVTIAGGSTVVLGNLDDVITVESAGFGANLLDGQGGNDVITGNADMDTLRGGEGDDQLSGNGGGDLLAGAAGNDLIDGGAGVDTASYLSAEGSVRVSLLLTTAQDTKNAGVDTISNVENLIGSNFSDTLIGDSAANRLDGRDGNDRLSGGFNLDTLIGGGGADRLTGGAGADTFLFTSVDDFGAKKHDLITDFTHTDFDRMDLSQIDPDRRTGGDQAFTFVGTAAFTAGGTDAQLRFEQVGDGRYIVQGDTDHDGSADFKFNVNSDAPLVASDFIL